VKVPFDYLSAEYLPKDDPRAQELAKEKAEASQFAIPSPASGLEGVRVIIDAGHGGRDTGTLHAGIWEATYVYDVACRLRKILTDRTKAEVVMTTRDRDDGWQTKDQDRLGDRRQQLLLTTPPTIWRIRSRASISAGISPTASSRDPVSKRRRSRRKKPYSSPYMRTRSTRPFEAPWRTCRVSDSFAIDTARRRPSIEVSRRFETSRSFPSTRRSASSRRASRRAWRRKSSAP